MTERLERCQPTTPDELDAAAEITAEDLAAAQEFWSYWGTPLFNALLNAEAKSEGMA